METVLVAAAQVVAEDLALNEKETNLIVTIASLLSPVEPPKPLRGLAVKPSIIVRILAAAEGDWISSIKLAKLVGTTRRSLASHISRMEHSRPDLRFCIETYPPPKRGAYRWVGQPLDE